MGIEEPLNETLFLVILNVKYETLQLLGIWNNTTKGIWSIWRFMNLFLLSRNQECFFSRVELGGGGGNKNYAYKKHFFFRIWKGSISSPKIVLVAWTSAELDVQVIMSTAGCCLVLKIWSLAAYWLSLIHAQLRKAFKILFGKRGRFGLNAQCTAGT